MAPYQGFTIMIYSFVNVLLSDISEHSIAVYLTVFLLHISKLASSLSVLPQITKAIISFLFFKKRKHSRDPSICACIAICDATRMRLA